MLRFRCWRNQVDYVAKTVEMGGKTYNEGDWISLNGSTGEVYDGQVPTTEPALDGDFLAIMNLADKFTKTLVRTNADTPATLVRLVNSALRVSASAVQSICSSKATVSMPFAK